MLAKKTSSLHAAPRPRVRRPRGPPCRGRRGLFRWMRMCVCLGFEPLQIPCVRFVKSQRAGAAVSGLHHGRRRVASAPRFLLYVRCAGPCRPHGGSCVLVSGASVAQGAMCMWCVGWMHVQRHGWGIAVYGSCSVVRLFWWASICCVFLWWFPALVPTYAFLAIASL